MLQTRYFRRITVNVFRLLTVDDLNPVKAFIRLTMLLGLELTVDVCGKTWLN